MGMNPVLVLFDGDCPQCHGWVRFITARDAQGRFHCTPLRSEAGQAVCRSHGLDAARIDSVVVVVDGTAYLHSGAVLAIACRLPWPWPLLGLGYAIPRVLRDGLYRAQAARRQRQPGSGCPLPDALLPNLPHPPARWPHSAGQRWRFWAGYWCWFLLLLPWMLLRQLAVSACDLWWAWRTAGRTWQLCDGRLQISFLGHSELLLTAGMFGERFTLLRWGDVVIDPGPARCRDQALRALADGTPPALVVCTHLHEEHIGNAALVAGRFDIPVAASAATLAALRDPPRLPGGRSLLMGVARVVPDGRLTVLGPLVVTGQVRLEVIAAEGHCAGHVVLFARDEGVLFAGDAFLHELFTSPNADADHRAWIPTLERLAELPVRTLVGAHGAIISCDPALPPIPGVVVRGDPRQRIAAKLAFLRRVAAIVADGERNGIRHAIIEAVVFPWHRPWAWRTWFHDEGFRLLTCGEFSRTHLIRSLSARPERVPVRFPALRRLGARLAESGPELLRIHLLAGRPESVLVIAGSILLSAWALLALAPGASLDDPIQRLIAAGPAIADHPARLLALLSLWTIWWWIVGGAITRRMALAVAGENNESWGASLRWCLRPGLAVPSALASVCLLAVACAPRWPWALLAMPAVWLVAGLLYAGLCLPPGQLSYGWAGLTAILRHPWPFLRRQLGFLVGFALSTGAVHAAAAAWIASIHLLAGSWSWWALALAAPAAVYALGYTTANLKSLQIWLWLRRDDP